MPDTGENPEFEQRVNAHQKEIVRERKVTLSIALL